MKRILSTFMAVALCALIGSAQVFSDDIVVISSDGSAITVEATASAEKKKDAEILAAKSAFNALFHTGLDGVKGGKPMLTTEKKDYDYRFFNESRYLNYIRGGLIKGVSSKKVANMQRATVQLTILVDPLLADMKRNKLAISPAWQDSKATDATSALNPSIVVVPYVPGGSGDFEAMRAAVDSSPLTKFIVSAVSAEFSKRGYKTRDFIAQLQNSRTNDVLQAGTQADAATRIAQQLPGDIVVTVETNVDINGNRQGQCDIAVRAVEKQTAGNLAAATFSSGRFMNTDSTALAEYALKNVTADFFSGLQSAFENMVAQGREIIIELTLSESVDDWDFDQDSPATGDYFKDTFDEWLRAAAHQGRYEMGTNTDKFIRATVNIPLWNMERDRSYTVSNFGSDIRKFLKAQLGDEYKANVTALGQRLNIVIE